MLEIWTDGACEPNPGIGGWAFHRSDGQEAHGGELNTTNNRMELLAIVKALQSLPEDKKTMAVIYSDSQYCVKGMTVWLKGWKRRGWSRKNGELLNADLWQQLDAEISKRLIRASWVKGHASNAGNIKADMLAEIGRSSVLEAK